LIINFFIEQRGLEDFTLFIADLIERIRTKPLFTSDELPHYQTALMEHYSHCEAQPKTGKRGRPRKPTVVIDPELKYARVHKIRENGKVIKVERTIIFGDPETIEQILTASRVSSGINKSFIERSNLTLRNHNRRLTRKTLCFAKQKQALQAQTTIVITCYNFSLPHRGLTMRDSLGRRIKRTPAMAATLIDRIWPMGEILAYPMI